MDILTLTVEAGPGGEARIKASGEIDLSTSAAFRQAVLPVAFSSPLVVDLTGVNYMDSAGAFVLMEAAKVTGRENMTVLLAAHSQPARVMSLMGLYTFMQMEEVSAESEAV